MIELIDGETYKITCQSWANEPDMTLNAVWDKDEQAFVSGEVRFGLYQVTLIEGKVK